MTKDPSAEAVRRRRPDAHQLREIMAGEVGEVEEDEVTEPVFDGEIEVVENDEGVAEEEGNEVREDGKPDDKVDEVGVGVEEDKDRLVW